MMREATQQEILLAARRGKSGLLDGLRRDPVNPAFPGIAIFPDLEAP